MPTDSTSSLPASVDETHRFPCGTCGADMRFDPTKHELNCPHCGAAESVDGGDQDSLREMSFDAQIDQLLDVTGSPEDTENTRISECNSCGARIEFPDGTHATQCPYCTSAIVADTGATRSHKPNGVLPFGLTQENARDALSEWIGSLWFAPNGVADYARKGRAMTGIYMPYWTYDAQSESSYRGARGKDYYVTTGSGENRRRQRKTRWTSVRGHVSRFFDDVLVAASHVLPRKELNALEPWDLGNLRPYTPDYLAGFSAESYTVSRKEGFAHARDIMKTVIERDIRFDIGGDRQRIQMIDTKVSEITFKHILLPVWAAAFKYRGETYRVLINGRTGRVSGERPYSKTKVFFAGLTAIFALAIVAYAIYLSENGGH